MTHRFLVGLSIGLVLAALTVPLARADEKYDGYKSGFPELRQIRQFARTLSPYDGYKSGLPELRQIRQFARTHQIVLAPVPASNSFDWPDAAIGAGGAAATIFILAAGALLVGRRRTKVAV